MSLVENLEKQLSEINEKRKQPITKRDISLLLVEANKRFGEGVLMMGDEVPDFPRISTGIAEFDAIIGGGLVPGRLYEFFGPYSVGKSSLSYEIMKQFHSTLFIDAERTYDAEVLKMHGMDDLSKVFVMQPKSAESAIRMACIAAEKGVELIIIDSVPALIPKATLTNDDFEKSDTIAALPRVLSSKLPILTQVCSESGTIVILINQIRVKMGGTKYDPYDTPGGHALRHLVSLRLQVGRKEFITDTKLGELGQVMKIKVVKSKISPPRGVVELPMFFDHMPRIVSPDQVNAIVDEMRIAAGGRAKNKRHVTEPEEYEIEED